MRKTLNKAMELGLGLKDDDSNKPSPVSPVSPLTKTEMAEYVGSYSHAPQVWEVSIKDDKLAFEVRRHGLFVDEERRAKVYLWSVE